MLTMISFLFELAANGSPIIVDPGSYLYTANPQQRNLFRSSSYHAVLQLDDCEQNVLSEDTLFNLQDRTKAELLHWDVQPEVTRFVGCHYGYQHLSGNPTYKREFLLQEDQLSIKDTIDSSVLHRPRWGFPLAPEVDLTIESPNYVTMRVQESELTISISSQEVSFSAVEGFISPAYGVRKPTRFLQGQGEPMVKNQEAAFLFKLNFS